MDTKAYVLDIRLECVSAGSDDLDGVAEFIGSFSYRPEGQSSWTSLAQKSGSSPWIVPQKNRIKVLPIGFKVNLPTSSTFIEVQSSIQEYDPTVFDNNEDLGTQTISVPVPAPGIWVDRSGSQGNGSIGQANIGVILVAAADWRFYG